MSAGFLAMWHTKFQQTAVKFSEGRLGKTELEAVAEEARNHTLALRDGTDIQEALKHLPFGALKTQILRDAHHHPKYIEALEIIDAHLKNPDSSR